MKKILQKSIMIAAVYTLSVVVPTQAIQYSVDTAHSTVGFKVKHLSVATVRGNFSEFSGTINWDGDNQLQTASFEGEIKVASIDTNNTLRDKHLKSDDFFEAKTYPDIRFKSKSVKKNAQGKLVIVGDFTMKDVTKEVEIPVEISGPIKKGSTSIIGIEGSLKINRRDYNLVWSNVLKDGTAVVSDTVIIELNLEATN